MASFILFLAFATCVALLDSSVIAAKKRPAAEWDRLYHLQRLASPPTTGLLTRSQYMYLVERSVVEIQEDSPLMVDVGTNGQGGPERYE